MKKIILLTLPFFLNGCNTIYDWADGVGKHLPTIGEPCEHWQCVTESGQKKSDTNKWLDEASEKEPTPKKTTTEKAAATPPPASK